MPWPGPPMHPPQGPALVLYPNNDSFLPKTISLVPSGTRVKIGRQTNQKTVPAQTNGYFDSKVLSRQHAEVWEEGGKIFIKDVKSSNGTFVNGERLSVEGVESDPWELKSEDRVEYGIDIVGEDNKTIIHHKVAATVYCVITPEDWAMLPIHHQQHPGLGNNFHLGAQQRRPSIQQLPSPGGLGGLGGPGLGLAGRTGKSGLSFDHILNRLQSELQKSREAGSDLSSLAGTMNDINESFQAGSHPPSHPPHQALPPVRPAPPAEAHEAHASPIDSSLSLTSLHSQLAQTQSSLASHVEKLHSLESVIADHHQMKLEVQHMRELTEQRQREMEMMITNFHSQKVNSRHEHVDDDDDRRSIMTLVPESSDPSTRESFGAERDHDEDERGRTEAIRPRTPEPHGLVEDEDDAHDGPRRFDDSLSHHPNSSNFSQGYPEAGPRQTRSHTPDELRSQNALLASRLETLTSQLDTALSLSRSLQQQAEAAQSNLEQLHARVESLEASIKVRNEEESQRQQQQQTRPEPEPTPVPADEEKEETLPSVGLDVWEAWTQRVEGQWKVEREEWDNERLRLKEAVREWEARMSAMESREEERVREGQGLLDAIKREREAELNSWSSSESDTLVKEPSIPGRKPLVNGVLKHATTSKRRNGSSTTSSSKHRKRKVQRPIPVATPPHSPEINGEIHSVEHSSEDSGSRPTSPAPPGNLRALPTDVLMNGHTKFGVLPISPAPSVHNGTRSGSADSEIDVRDEGQQRNVDMDSGPPPIIIKQNNTSSKPPGSNPLPLVSAAGVVFIGVAAWVVANRVKD